MFSRLSFRRKNRDDVPQRIQQATRPQTVIIVCPQGLDKVSSGSGSPMRPLSSDLNVPRIDSFRFSMANMEDTQDVDLDAILGELCALESQYEEAIQTSSKNNGMKESTRPMSTTSSVNGRTHSPDNDSAFSDSVSLLSSESSASSGRTDVQPQDPGSVKAEKIRLAMQKIKEASVKKMFIKVFSPDGSVKSLLVDEGMSCGYITRLLAEKHHQDFQPECALVEHLPELHMERVYEDHELLVEQLMKWTYDSKNKLLFCQRPERTFLFKSPQLFIGPSDAPPKATFDNNLLEEFFAGSAVPSVEGPLYIKTDSRKGWKRYHCILRASGLYYWPKDKAKSSSKDLICLATFDLNQVYYGVGWKKRYKAPSEYCFAIKHPALQEPTKSSKYIKYLCADDVGTMHRWVTAIRIIKHGRQLLVNYKSVLEECQLLSEPTVVDSASESGSSGCDVGFECDFPTGTIKRKPPKLPLTATTRQLKEIAIGGSLECLEELPPPPPELLRDDDDEEEQPPPMPLRSQDHAFLEDLHKVVRRKWQVAQKCKLDLSVSPQEVLGFRDPLNNPAEDYRENQVSRWVEDHYGVVPNIGQVPAGQGKKRPPPPPPRAVTTQLSTVQKC